MARPKKQPTELMENIPLNEDLNVNLNAMAEHRVAIMQQFGDGLPYERDRIVHEARFYMAQSAEAMLEAGKRLILLKENEPHGEYVEIVREHLGLEPRIAQKMAQAALKFLSPSLESKAKALSHLGRTKLYELMLEDDEELAQLADGGTIAGMTLDDVDRMTSRELKAALRESRENAIAQQRVLADKNQKIDTLSTKLEKKALITPPAPDEQLKKMRAEAAGIGTDAEAAIIVQLSNAFSVIAAHCDEHQLDLPVDFMAGVVCQIERGVHALRETFNLEAEPTGNERPAWLDAPEPTIN